MLAKTTLKNALLAEQCFKLALKLCADMNQIEPAEITKLIKSNYANIEANDVYTLVEWISYCCL